MDGLGRRGRAGRRGRRWRRAAPGPGSAPRGAGREAARARRPGTPGSGACRPARRASARILPSSKRRPSTRLPPRSRSRPTSPAAAARSKAPRRRGVVVPSLIIAAARLARPVRSAGSNWLDPPRNVMLKETSGRSCFSETMRSAPFASVAFVQVGTRSSGVFPGAGTSLRSNAFCASIPAGRMTASAVTAATSGRRIIDAPPRRWTAHSSLSCSRSAWPPDRPCPPARRSGQRGRLPGTLRRRA